MSEVVCRQMNMSWGVVPYIIDEKNSTDELFAAAVEAAEEHRLVEDGDLVAITAGVPLGVSGTTNLMKVERIGNGI
jgi:pyruvate kinase